MAENEKVTQLYDRHSGLAAQPDYASHQTTRKPVKRLVQKRRRRLYNAKMLFIICGLSLFVLLFGQLYLDAQLNQVHRQIERTRFTISRETVINEQLQSHVSELSQHARIIEIANARGLTFNENIIYIQR